MDSSKLKVILIVTLAAIFALYLGVAAATAQLEAIAWVGGMSILVFLLSMGRHVWAVIPIAGALSGGLSFIPGFPQPWYAATPIIAGFILIRFLLRSNMFQFRWTWLDTFMLFQCIVLFQAYLRNPTGLALFSGSMVGGRPYFDYAVAITSYFLLTFIKSDIKTFKRVALAVILVNLGDDLLRAATGFSGPLSQAVGRIYSNVDYAANEGGAAFSFDLKTTRFGGLMDLGITLSLICFSFNRPLACFSPFKPLAFLMLMLSIVSSLLSGFRSALIRIGCYFIVGSWIRKKPFDSVIGGLLGTMGILFLGATIGLTQLPSAAQRALAFLPFEVSDEAKYGAEASSDWRFKMWRIVLTSDRYIHNKLLGDGFGYSMAEHEAQMKVMQTGASYMGDSIDMFIAKGSYHGFHVEAIRFTGVLGLIVGVILLFAFARYAGLAIRHYRGTEYFNYVIFICMPFLIEPLYYLLVFGSYKNGFVALISSAGILRVLDNIRINEIATIRDSGSNSTAPLTNLSQNPKRSPLAQTH